MTKELHGHNRRGKRSRLYTLWADIKSRCRISNKKDAKHYAIHGLVCHEPWKNSFIEFHKYISETLGARPDKHSLDRIDNAKGYIPGNLRWANATQQRINQRKKYNIKTTSKYKGVYKTERIAKTKGLQIRWVASIGINKKVVHLGRFKTEKEAALVYNKAALKYHGSEAKLNKV